MTLRRTLWILLKQHNFSQEQNHKLDKGLELRTSCSWSEARPWTSKQTITLIFFKLSKKLTLLRISCIKMKKELKTILNPLSVTLKWMGCSIISTLRTDNFYSKISWRVVTIHRLMTVEWRGLCSGRMRVWKG